jgi:hypothetical protein
MPALGFAAPARLEDWEGVDLDHSIGPWISRPVRTWVPRWNFYLRHGYQRPGESWARRLLHRAARTRVRLGFYRLDVERRAVDAWKRRRTGIDRQQPLIAED